MLEIDENSNNNSNNNNNININNINSKKVPYFRWKSKLLSNDINKTTNIVAQQSMLIRIMNSSNTNSPVSDSDDKYNKSP
jgi:hypothetical protein